MGIWFMGIHFLLEIQLRLETMSVYTPLQRFSTIFRDVGLELTVDSGKCKTVLSTSYFNCT